MTEKVVFVTVGTTKFDLLVDTITQRDVLKVLKEKGYDTIIIQIGNGSVIPDEEAAKINNMNLSYYRFKNSIREDILRASLIISHAGAGTCLEVLSEQKPLLVVINEKLMHNHQRELAEQLSSEGCLFSCTCENLKDVIRQEDFSKPKEFLLPKPKVFSDFLDKLMGFKT